MKKIMILIFFFLVIVFYVSQAFSEVVVVKVEKGILKDTPQGGEIGMIIEGVTCEKIAEEDEWMKVRVEGWIKASEVIVLKIDIDKEDKQEKKKKKYIELAAGRLKAEAIEIHESKRVSFKGKFEGIFVTERKVANHVNFTVSSVECSIPTKDSSKIKDLKRGDSVRVYGKVKRGLRYPPWYYVGVDEIVKE